MRTRRFFILFASFAAASACSGPSTNGGPLTAGSACHDLVTQYCGRLNVCAPSTVNAWFGSVGECVTRNQPVCEQALKATGTGATPASVETCAGLYATLSCSEVDSNRRPQGCSVAGSLAPGSACGDDSQCSGTNPHCHIPSGQVCGTCGSLGGHKAACVTDRDCAPGLVCAAGGVCLPFGAAGDPCEGSDKACPETLFCAGGFCAQPVGLGTACDPAGDMCDPYQGFRCDAQSRVCIAESIVAVGAACGLNDLCANSVCEGAVGAQSVCVASLPDGAACDLSAYGATCSAPSLCLRGVCTLPNAAQCH